MNENSISGLLLSQILEDDVLCRFVPKARVSYYRERFLKLIEASGLGGTPISEIGMRQLAAGFVKLPIKSRLPWTHTTLFNWAGFFGTVVWMAWRRVAGCWWIIGGLGIIVSLFLLGENFYRVSLGTKFGWAFSFVAALFGTEFFFARILIELKSGRVRKRPSSLLNLVWAILLFISPIVIAGVSVEKLIADEGQACNGTDGFASEAVIHGCSALINWGNTKKETLARAYFIRGLTYWRKNENDRAIEDYTQAIRIDARYTNAFYNRGLAFARKSNFDSAIQDYNSAIQINPSFVDAVFMRGHAFAAKGDNNRAIADYEQAIRLNPKYKAAYNSAGIIHLTGGDFDFAIENFDKAIELDAGFADAYNNRGLAYKAKGNIDLAIESYNGAIRLNPKSARLFLNRGIARTITGQFDPALSDFDAAVRLEPKNAIALYGRGVAKMKLGDGAGGGADLAAAKAINANIEKIYAGLGGH